MTSMVNNILLVDDDPGTIQLLGRMLSGCGDLRFAMNGEDALRLAREQAPDLILLDAEMPGMSGFEVCEALQADAVLAQVPVIFVTSHSGEDLEVAGFKAGAVDFIAKPVSAPLVLARVSTQLRVKRMADELRQFAMVDVLTALPNRRAFDAALRREWRRARRSGEPLALMMLDVDEFKPFNDRYGHPAGDACLRSVAGALALACRRPGDLSARIGGDEFVLLLPQTPRSGAEYIAHRVLSAVKALGIGPEPSSMARPISLSVGIACYDAESEFWIDSPVDSRFSGGPGGDCCADTLVQAADKALYSAKHAGRGQARMLDIADVDAPQRARLIDGSGLEPAALEWA